MDIKFEDHNTAQTVYNQKDIKNDLDFSATYQGNSYVKAGESYKQLDSIFYKVIQLVATVALGIFLLGIPFLSSHFRQGIRELYHEVSTKQEKVIHYIPEMATPAMQHDVMRITARTLNSAWETMHTHQHIQAQQAKCFVSIKFYNEIVRKEFIFRPANNQSITTDFFKEKVSKIRTYLDDYVDTHDLGLARKMHCMVLFKDNNELHQFAEDYEFSKDNLSTSTGQSIITKIGIDGLKVIIAKLANQLVFPKEKQIANDNFIPGMFYYDLAAVVGEHDLDAVPAEEMV